VKKKIGAAVASLALVLAFAVPASADSTANGDHPNANGTCFGNQASDYASTSKSNSTGQAVATQATTAPGYRADKVNGYQSDCPRNE
jgi:hypothetical protein